MSKTIEEIKAKRLLRDYIESKNNQIQELTDWKESMMKVHSELDLQGIGTALELPLGSSIAPQVLPRVKELIEQNAELVEAVWYLYNFSKGMHFHEGSKTDKEISELLSKHSHLNKI